VTRELLIIAAKVQYPTYFHTPLVFLSRIWDQRITWSGSASASR